MPQGLWVRVPLPVPRRSKLYIACSDLFYKSERAHAAAPPFQLRPATAELRFGIAASGRFYCAHENIGFNRPLHVGAKSTLLRRFYVCGKKMSSAHASLPERPPLHISISRPPASKAFLLYPTEILFIFIVLSGRRTRSRLTLAILKKEPRLQKSQLSLARSR